MSLKTRHLSLLLILETTVTYNAFSALGNDLKKGLT